MHSLQVGQVVAVDVFLYYAQDDKHPGTCCKGTEYEYFVNADRYQNKGNLGSLYWCAPGKREAIPGQQLQLIGMSERLLVTCRASSGLQISMTFLRASSTRLLSHKV